MTALVAFMNKLGVVVAADSAIEDKITRTVSCYKPKLFKLTDDPPVALLTYGTSNFMPSEDHDSRLEVILKQYAAREMTAKDASTVNSTSQFLLNTLEEDRVQFPKERQRHSGLHCLRYLFGDILEQNPRMFELLRRAAGTGERSARNIALRRLEEFVKEEIRKLKPRRTPPAKTAKAIERVNETYGYDFGTYLLEETPLGAVSPPPSKRLLKRLLELGALQLMTQGVVPNPEFLATLVFVGIGLEQETPEICAFTLRGILLDRLLCTRDLQRVVSDSNPGCFESWGLPGVDVDDIRKELEPQLPEADLETLAKQAKLFIEAASEVQHGEGDRMTIGGPTSVAQITKQHGFTWIEKGVE
ncbi:hypothetical protein ACFL6C_10650 [Myxococcota bacterium]